MSLLAGERYGSTTVTAVPDGVWLAAAVDATACALGG
jgi:hypothetical protein